MAAPLTIFQSDDTSMQLMQTSWAASLNPLLKSAVLQGVLLKNVNLAAGANVVNHRLGRKLQGWMLTRIRSAATTYDTQDSNQTPELTLNLTSSAAVVVDLYVF